MKHSHEDLLAKLKAVADAALSVDDDEDPALEDWEYLIHHVHVDDDGKETIHHCDLVDHLGNLYVIEHVTDEKGDIRHCVTGLKQDQDVYWSDDEAEAAGEEIPCANRQIDE